MALKATLGGYRTVDPPEKERSSALDVTYGSLNCHHRNAAAVRFTNSRLRDHWRTEMSQTLPTLRVLGFARQATLVCVASILVGACSRSSGSAPAPASSEAQSKAPETATATHDRSADVPDPALAALVRKVASGCRMQEKILQCSDDSQSRQQLADEFLKGQRSRLAALPTLIRLLSSSDETLMVVTSELLATGFSVGLGKDLKPGAVDKSVVAELLETRHRLPPYRGRRLLPVTVHAAMLAGEEKALYALLDADEDLLARAVDRLMMYGRLRAFDKIKVIVASSQNERHRVNAMAALRNMPDWTAEEQNVLCPWALDYLGDVSAGVSARAAQALVECRAEHVDATLERARAMHAEGKLDRLRLVAVRDVCRHPEHLEDGRCATTVAFLQSLIDERSNPTDLRTAALSALHYQVPQDQKIGTAKGSVLLTKVANKAKRDKDAEVALAAKDMLRRLEGADAREKLPN